jgi:hypothetical protein
MRWAEIFSEAVEVGSIQDLHSSKQASVFDITSRLFLDRVIQKTHYKDVRGILTDTSLHVWDAEMAAHGAYERNFGNYGSRIMLQGGSGHYNISYYSREETPDAIKDSPIFRRLFTPDMLQTMTFETLDDFLPDAEDDE